MNNQLLTLYKKEIYTLLKSPVFYASCLVFHLVLAVPFIGFDFWFNAKLSELNFFFLNIPLVYSLVIPMLTISIWSDEYKYETDKILFSFPVSDYTIVLAKYLALCSVFAVMLLISMIIPLSIMEIGYFNTASFLISYISALLFGLACTALSQAVASISSHSAICFLLSLLTIAFFSLIHIFTKVFTLPMMLEKIINVLSFQAHFEMAARGIFDTRDFIFYIALGFLGIELNVFILRLKKDRR